MKLYHHPISHNCRRVLATIFENGLQDSIEQVQVDLFEGANRKPDFLAINPNGMVPVLVDGDFKLWESNAIMQYLSQDSSLWPKSNVRYDIIRWQCWGIAHWGQSIGAVVFERLVKGATGGGAADEAKVAKGLEGFQRWAQVLDAHLEGRDWLVGEGLTLADYSVAANLTYAQFVGIPVKNYSNLARWYGQIEQRDAWKQSAPPPMG